MAKRTGKPLPPRAPSGPQASAGLAVSPRRAQEVAALFQLGLQLQQRGHLQEAQALYERVLRLHPSHFDALHLLGVIAALSNAPERALQLLDAAISVNPACAPAYSNRGNVLQALGRLEEALASFDRAISLEPKYTDAHFNRGNTLKQLGRLEEAVASYDQAIAIHAGHAPAWSNRGDALQQLMRLEDAVVSYTQAISAQPDYAEAHNNLGVGLRELNRPAEALARCEAAIACRPDFAQAHSNRGIALQELHRVYEAVASYDRAISLQPDFAGAHHNKALALLLAGRYEEGWPLYEWRWKNPDSGLSPRFPDYPLWLGDCDLTGKTILLHSEQGLGDTLQFCRYASLVAQRGARVLLEVQPALAGLLRGLAGVSEVLRAGDALPPFDLHCPLMSLPLAFGTTLHTIPAAEGYLNCSTDKLQAWRERLGPRTQPRVGLVWSGNPAYKADSRRSLPLEQLLQHLPEGIEYVSLQKDVRERDLPALSTSRLRHFGAEHQDFADSAALCELVDVVVSVDTSGAHLAAALGRPTWLLLPHTPDWRWLLKREDSPWYESMRLFRQGVEREWGPVLARLSERLVAHQVAAAKGTGSRTDGE